MWEFYLAYCEAGFRTGYLDVAQVRLERGGRPPWPPDGRADDVDPVVPPRPAPERPPGAARGRRRRRRTCCPSSSSTPRCSRPTRPRTRRLLASRRVAVEGRPGGALVVRHGDPRRRRPARSPREVGAAAVHVSRETTPYGRRRDEAVGEALADDGVEWVATGTPYAVGPGRVVNGSGDAVQGLHAVLQGLARSTAGPPRRRRRASAAAPWLRDDADATAAGPGGAGPPRPARGRARRPRCERWARVPRRARSRLRRRPRPARPRRRPRGCRRTSSTARSTRARCSPTSPASAAQGAAHLRERAGLARVLRRRAVAPAATRRGTTCGPSCARMRYDEPERRASRRGSEGRTGYPIVDAGMRQLLARGLDAQPGADDHGQLPRQGPARLVAGRGPALPRPPRRRRPRLATTTAGSGWPAPAPTRRRTSGSSTRSPRA